MTPKSIAKLIRERFQKEKGSDLPWFVVGMSKSDNGDEHFVLFCDSINCYCKVTLNVKNEVTYLKFHC